MRQTKGHLAMICWLLALNLQGCRADETPSAVEQSTETATPPSTEAQAAPPAMRGALLEFQNARAAEETGDLETALGHSLEALEGMPHHPLVLRQTASLRARLEQHDGALELLERIAAVGGTVDLPADESAWAGLREDARFQTIAEALLTGAGEERPRGELAVTLDDAELYPEGIAYDPQSQAFLVGSMTRSKIVRVPLDGAQSDLVSAGQDGLLNPLGMAVDAERRGLWVASTAYPPHGGATAADAGRSAVFHFDVDHGELRGRYDLDERPKRHFLNDLDVSKAGEVYITDSETCTVYRLAPGQTALEPWLELAEINFANGIALSDDDRLLYVAHLEGMTRVDVATRQASRVAEAPGVAIGHGDGIDFVNGSLIVVQNQAVFDFRVARFFLDDDGRRAERTQVLHAGLVDDRLPFTGARVGDAFYFNVTSDLDAAEQPPRPPALLRVPL